LENLVHDFPEMRCFRPERYTMELENMESTDSSLFPFSEKWEKQADCVTDCIARDDLTSDFRCLDLRGHNMISPQRRRSLSSWPITVPWSPRQLRPGVRLSGHKKSINIGRHQDRFRLPQRARFHLYCSKSQVCLAELKPMTIFPFQKVWPLAPHSVLV